MAHGFMPLSVVRMTLTGVPTATLKVLPSSALVMVMAPDGFAGAMGAEGAGGSVAAGTAVGTCVGRAVSVGVTEGVLVALGLGIATLGVALGGELGLLEAGLALPPPQALKSSTNRMPTRRITASSLTQPQ